MSGVNRCIFVGHLGRDPEIKTAQNGVRSAVFPLGVNTVYTSADGGRKHRTVWPRIRVRAKGAVDYAEKYLRKGSKVYVCGEFAQWGEGKTYTEIHINPYSGELIGLDKRDSAADAEAAESMYDGASDAADMFGAPAGGEPRPGMLAQERYDGRNAHRAGAPPPPADDFEDDIPF